MKLSLQDGWTFLYHYGIVLSGAYVVWFYGIEDRTRILWITLVLAIVWSVYFRFRMAPRFAETDDSKGGGL